MLIVQSIFRPQAMNNVVKLSASQIINKRNIPENCQPFLLRSESHIVINSCQIQNHEIPWMCNINTRSFSTTTPWCNISKSPGDPKMPMNMFILFGISASLAISYSFIFGDDDEGLLKDKKN